MGITKSIIIFSWGMYLICAWAVLLQSVHFHNSRHLIAHGSYPKFDSYFSSSKTFLLMNNRLSNIQNLQGIFLDNLFGQPIL